MGKWCGTESSYAISAKSMVVTRHSDSARLIFEVVSYETARHRCWCVAACGAPWGAPNSASSAPTAFKMAQLRKSEGPRREFRRC